MQLKALLLKDNRERSELLEQSLQDLGHAVLGEITTFDDLAGDVEATKPDMLIVDSESPDSSLLSRLRQLAVQHPLPVVLFTADDSRDTISGAVKAGVSAYIVDGPDQKRLGVIIDVAVARFQETERLRRELLDIRSSLAERKAVERAKGILMKQRGFDEPQAYHALRKMAMDKNLRIGQVAENVIAVAELLN